MSLIPSDAKKIEVDCSSVDFFENIENGLSVYYFDTSKCGPPDPMVNAMCGLNLIRGTNKKLVMINSKTPGGLFSKLESDISYIVQELDSGLVKVVFSSIEGIGKKSDLTQTSCSG